MNVIEAMDDPNLFAPWFKAPTSWFAWRVVLKALFALRMDGEERSLFHRIAGGRQPPGAPVRESWWVIGRRGGKSFMVALVAVYLACFHDYARYLAPGERATVMVLAADRKQARVIFRYIRALLSEVPMLARMIERETAESIDLTNRITIEVHTASNRSVRGYTIAAALLDEVAFWYAVGESANPDTEIVAALRPAMATIPTAMLIGIGSPYRRTGVLYEAHKSYFGADDLHTLVVQADTRTMNPAVPQRTIDEAYQRDPARAAAEYGAEFRTDVESFVSLDVVDACTAPNRHELPPESGMRYYAFVDPSGGSADSMTLAIAHRNRDGVATLDLVREIKPPFSPEAVVEEFTGLVRRYRLSAVVGDKYAGEWPREQFRKRGIDYRTSDRSKSEIYVDLLPALNSHTVELLDNDRLRHQLVTLERRTARGGRDSVDHPPRGHDDLINAAGGALVLATEQRRNRVTVRKLLTGAPVDLDAPSWWPQ